ncbi:MAG: ATP-binding cassette domain-containing protein [Anaerolineales bacterium]|nr:ATP-binding cassette domain-containing protein [Anaerolineales bacterium]
MSDIAVKVDDVGKQYHIGGPQKSYDRLGEQVFDAVSAPFRRATKLLTGQAKSAAEFSEQFWALQSVSFEIKHGEAVGIIGRNGAGKSTLLKILSRITEPTKGYADIYGRVGSLLEVGTGFHPELTGKENIFLNGAILGMKKAEIDRKFDEIVAFAEIDRFIDTPVKHYSSGMYVRLAFSVAAHLEPEVLLVDEVLAVGDVAFQRKCLGKMDDVAHQGRTVLFVSHNMGLMQTICKRGIFLQNGTVAKDGPISEVVDAYLKSIEQKDMQDLEQRKDRRGLGKAKLLGVDVRSCNTEYPTIIKTGGTVQFAFHVNNVLPGMNMNFSLFDQIGQAVVQFRSKDRSPKDTVDVNNANTFICEIDPFLVLPGRYRVDVGIVGDNRMQDYVEAATFIDVAEGFVDGRLESQKEKFNVCIPHQWILPVRN